MNNKGNGSWIIGFCMVVIGLFLSVGLFMIRCINKGANGLYDITAMNTCVTQPTTLILFGIGIAVGTIGVVICSNSNR